MHARLSRARACEEGEGGGRGGLRVTSGTAWSKTNEIFYFFKHSAVHFNAFSLVDTGCDKTKVF